MTGAGRAKPGTEVADSQAFSTYYGQTYKAILKFAYAKTQNMQDAEDLTQDAFASLSMQWEEMSNVGDNRLRKFLFSSVARRHKSLLRRLFVRRRHEPTLLASYTGAITHVEDDVLANDSAVELRRLFGKLPARQRQVAVLYWIEDLTDDEIAATLGVTASTVRTCRERARKALASKWKDLDSSQATFGLKEARGE